MATKREEMEKWLRGEGCLGKASDDEPLFVLDMLEFLRKTAPHLDRFLAGRGGIRQDDHLSMDFAAVRQLVNGEFPELAARLADAEGKKVVKRRPGTVDLSPLSPLTRKR